MDTGVFNPVLSFVSQECSFLCIWWPLLLLDLEPAVCTNDNSADETLINDLWNVHSLTHMSVWCVVIICWMINYPWLLAIIASGVLIMADADLVMNSGVGGKENLQKPELGG